MIRLGERLRGNGYNWNHAAFITGLDTIVEALGKGVTSSPISKYQDTEFLVVWDPSTAQNDNEQMLAFVESVLKEKTKYDYLEILCLGITMLLRLGKYRLLFGFSGTMICSGLVGETLTRSGAIFDVPPGYLTPADLDNWVTAQTSVKPS